MKYVYLIKAFDRYGEASCIEAAYSSLELAEKALLLYEKKMRSFGDWDACIEEVAVDQLPELTDERD